MCLSPANGLRLLLSRCRSTQDSSGARFVRDSWSAIPVTSSLQFLAPKPHFLLGDGAESFSHELSPLFSKLFDGLFPVTINLSRVDNFFILVRFCCRIASKPSLTANEKRNERCPNPSHSSSLASGGSILKAARARSCPILNSFVVEAFPVKQVQKLGLANDSGNESLPKTRQPHGISWFALQAAGRWFDLGHARQHHYAPRPCPRGTGTYSPAPVLFDSLPQGCPAPRHSSPTLTSGFRVSQPLSYACVLYET